MAELIWISRTIAQFIHDDQIAAHGGAYGLLNAGMLVFSPNLDWQIG